MMQDVSIHLPGILLAYSAFLLAIASPGPNILAVIGTSMSVSRSSGVALAVGVATGSFSWALLTVFGLSAILAAYAEALVMIKIFGGLYLLWLAYKSFKSAAASHDIKPRELAGGRRTLFGYFKRGYIVQMTNPKAALAWIAIISLGLKDDAPVWVAASIVLGTFALSMAIHFLYAIAFSTPVMVRLYSKARRVIQGVLGVFFAVAGLRLLTSRS
ncbi:MAG: LysE family transporter [Thalassospira sp.]|uniref:LysE family translocator n=1 Tax=Thalassospira sp. TaxID=1912094 RepID=UPI0032EE753E